MRISSSCHIVDRGAFCISPPRHYRSYKRPFDQISKPGTNDRRETRSEVAEHLDRKCMTRNSANNVSLGTDTLFSYCWCRGG